jgi:hypothetical protein
MFHQTNTMTRLTPQLFSIAHSSDCPAVLVLDGPRCDQPESEVDCSLKNWATGCCRLTHVTPPPPGLMPASKSIVCRLTPLSTYVSRQTARGYTSNDDVIARAARSRREFDLEDDHNPVCEPKLGAVDLGNGEKMSAQNILCTLNAPRRVIRQPPPQYSIRNVSR